MGGGVQGPPGAAESWVSLLLRVRRDRHKSKRRPRWTTEQIEAIYRVAWEGVWRSALIGAYTGLRLLDVLSLRWEQITPEDIE